MRRLNQRSRHPLIKLPENKLIAPGWDRTQALKDESVGQWILYHRASYSGKIPVRGKSTNQYSSASQRMTEWQSDRVNKASLMLILPCEVIIWSSVILTDKPSSKDQKSLNIFCSRLSGLYDTLSIRKLTNSLNGYIPSISISLSSFCMVGRGSAGGGVGWGRSQFQREKRFGNLVIVDVLFLSSLSFIFNFEKWCLCIALVVQICDRSLVKQLPWYVLQKGAVQL
jgi:hypothetical protein